MVYNGIRTNVFKRVLSFEPAIGLTTCIRYNDGDIGGDGGGRLTGPALILVSNERKGIEYNVKKVFFLLEARGQIKYELSKSFAICFGGGYCQGTSVIGRVNATYTRPPATDAYYITKILRGTNYYFNIGFCTNIGGLLQDI